MQLKDFTIPRTKIDLPGPPIKGEKPFFMVRGITLDDMTFLVSQHLGPITRAVKMYQESKADILTTGSFQGFIMAMARDFPDLLAEVISAAADSLDDTTRAVAKQLPLSTQIIALNEIVRLTVEDAGGLKNLLAEMQERLKAAAASVEEK